MHSFLRDVSNTVLSEGGHSIRPFAFSFSDMNAKTQEKVRTALMEEARNKTYIENALVTDTAIKSFLQVVRFVVGGDEKAAYIKSLVAVSDEVMPDERTLATIFADIRKAQTDLKNNDVCKIEIESPSEALYYGRHLRTDHIREMIVSRIINSNPVGQEAPVSFLPVVTKHPAERQKELIEDCQLNISKQLFDKNSTEVFWRFFESSLVLVKQNPSWSIKEIQQAIKSEVKTGCRHLDSLAQLYFIAQIKDGIR